MKKFITILHSIYSVIIKKLKKKVFLYYLQHILLTFSFLTYLVDFNTYLVQNNFLSNVIILLLVSVSRLTR